MKALAEILLDAGWLLTGSDASPDPNSLAVLSARGLTINAGHHADLSGLQPDIVISSAAIPENNSERQQAERLAIPQISYVTALAGIFNERHGIAICGTHGKSSTTALATHLLTAGGFAPTFACGAQRISDRKNGEFRASSLMVAEACEYARHFLELKPQTICLLGIEEDHFDCYPTVEDACRAYQKFAGSLPEDGRLIVNADCPRAIQIANALRAEVSAFSVSDPATAWFGERIGPRVRVFHHGEEILVAQFFQPGAHALSNLVAAIATTYDFGVNGPSLPDAIAGFQGLARRFQIISQSEARTVIDDYAHHPTEIRATLLAAREQFPTAIIRCVFQPHQVLRTQRLLREFAEALCLADQIAILPVYAAREINDADRVALAKKLAGLICEIGTECSFLPSLDQLPPRLETTGQSHEVILTIGAGDITRIHNDCTRSIQ